MSALTMETIARGAVLASRRTALLAIAGGAATAAVTPATGKRGRKRKNAKRTSRDRCQRQVNQCRDVLIAGCAEDGCDGRVDEAVACCQPFSVCDAGEAIACLFAL